MTEDKTARLIFALGLNDPEHYLRAKDIIAKIATKKLELNNVTSGKTKLSVGNINGGSKLSAGNINGGSKLKVNDIVTEYEQKAWLGHVEKIVKKYRDIYGIKNEHVPYPLPAKTKIAATKLFKEHYNPELKAFVEHMKKQAAPKKR